MKPELIFGPDLHGRGEGMGNGGINNTTGRVIKVKSWFRCCAAPLTRLTFNLPVRGVSGPGQIRQSDHQGRFFGGLWQIHHDCPEQIRRRVCGYSGECHPT